MLLFRLSGILTLLGWSTAYMNSEICGMLTDSCGKIPPPLPSSFIMKGTKLDQVTKNFVWFEEYFDPDNLRGKYVVVDNGFETHFMYDYYNGQVVTYNKQHPGGTVDKNSLSSMTCNAVDMDQSPFTKELGQKFGYYDPLMPRMYNAYETLRYGGPYAFAYNGSYDEDTDRGVPYMKFIGCVYDENYDATYDMSFSWSTGGLFTPSGTNYPFHIIENGGYNTEAPGEETEPLWHPVQSAKSIATFEENPYMDHDTFQPPMRMVCQNKRTKDPYPLPTVPLAFSTSMEIVSLVETWEGEKPNTTVFYNELWYDSDLRLVRFDHLPSDAEKLILLLNSFDQVTMVTSVHDFNTGLSFYTDKVQGMCVIQPILVASDIFFLSNTSTEGNAIMASPSEVLGIDSTLSYKGRYRIRDVDCKGYSGQVKVAPNQPIPMLREVYVSTDMWHEDLGGQENSDIPITDIQVFTVQVNGKNVEAVEQTNYYNFQLDAPLVSAYDITSCAHNMKRRSFELQIQVSNPAVASDQIIKKHFSKFVNEAHLSLLYRANLGSPLRVQDLEVILQDKDPIRLRFTLLDQFSEKGTVLNPRLGLPLDQAVETLKRDLSGLTFFTLITDTKQKEEIQFDVAPNSLLEVTIVKNDGDETSSPSVTGSTTVNTSPGLPGSTTPSGLSPTGSTTPGLPETTTPSGLSSTEYVSTTAASIDTKTKDTEKSMGYSNGAVTGLCFAMVFIGLALGAAAMFLYFTKFRQPNGSDTVNLQLADSTP